MNALSEILFSRLRPILASFADRVLLANPTLIHDLGSTQNDAFLLRAYLSFRAHDDGDEISVTIDIRFDAGVLRVESDACRDNGEIVAAGPTAMIPWKEDQSIPNADLSNWLDQLDQFLREIEAKIVQATLEFL